MTKIFNKDWRIETPYFEIKTTQRNLETKLKDLELKTRHKSLYSSDFLGDIIYLVWLSTLTLIIIIIIISLYLLQLSTIKQEGRMEGERYRLNLVRRVSRKRRKTT